MRSSDLTRPTSTDPFILQASSLGKCFGSVWALRDVNFTVQGGEFLALLGRNGAGKSTLVRLLSGQMRATTGTLRVQGMDVASRPLALRKRMGVMPDTTALLDGLTGAQYLHFAGGIHGLDTLTIHHRLQELAQLLEMDFYQSTLVSGYSFGMKKKLAFATAVLHGPRVLLLDEPFEGLDPVSSHALQACLGHMHAQGVTILLTSHLLGHAERLCSRFLIIDQGEVMVDSHAVDLLHQSGDLEQLFFHVVGHREAGALTWMS